MDYEEIVGLAGVGDVPDFRALVLRAAHRFSPAGVHWLQRRTEPIRPGLVGGVTARVRERMVVRIADLSVMSDEEAELRARAEYDERLAAHRGDLAHAAEKVACCEAVLAEARAWVPPTPEHEPLKRFALGRLEREVEAWSKQAAKQAEKAPTRLDGSTWRRQEIESAEHTRRLCVEQEAEEHVRVEIANEWIAALYKSLNAEMPPPDGADVL